MKAHASFRWSLRLWLFLLVVAGFLGTRIWWVPEEILGDWQEYFLTAQAIANHASPDIRLEDTRALEPTLSVPAFRESIQGIGNGIASAAQVPAPGFMKAMNGSVYAIHYFGYSAMTAAVHVVTGMPFSLAFKTVNALFVLILAVAAYRLLGSFMATAAALLLFMLCGGYPYLTWQSPEVVSAAGLLSALILMHCGAVGTAAILLGLAAMQNPTIIFSFGIVPLFYLLARGFGWILQVPWAGMWSRPRTLAGVVLGGALALLPIAFNLWAFRTPNIIAKVASDTSLIGWDRLYSFFLDLNQGMAPNAVGLFAGCVIVFAWALRRPAGSWHAPSPARYMPLAVVLAVAMAIPTLAAPNWNSGAFGMMRYAFWAAMPFLFALLVGVSEKRSLRHWVFAVAIGLQLLTGLVGYPEIYVRNTQLADWVMGRHPALYNPDPEIFVERLRHNEDALDSRQVYVFWYGKQPSKVLFHGSNLDIQQAFCDAQSRISDRVDSAAAARGWQYLNGAITCDPGPQRMMTADLAHFTRKDDSALVSGWSSPQDAPDPLWRGAWSIGERSVVRLRLASPQTIDAVHFSGHYYGDNRDTRVLINGVDFGLFPLGPDGNRVPIRGRLGESVDTLTIELVHQKPRSPLQDGAADPRVLAFFLRAVSVQFH